MSEPNCPKCGAGATRDPIEAKPTRWMSCGSEFIGGTFVQCNECRIRELEQKCERLAKDKERLINALAERTSRG